MHDSRGAALKVGDRVFIEAEVKELCSGDDTGYCNVTIQVVTPQQVKPPEMTPPSLSAINTRMLTKIGAVLLFAAMLFGQSVKADDKPQYFLNADGSVEQRVAKVEGDVAALKARVVELEKAAGIVSAKPKAAPCACGENCPCLAAVAASAPVNGHWERQRVGLLRSRDVWVEDTPQIVQAVQVQSATAGSSGGQCVGGVCYPTRRR